MTPAIHWFSLVAALSLVAACGSETDQERQARLAAQHGFSATQAKVMDAMLTGLNREARHPRNVSEAACYARRVSLADRFLEAHIAYITDYQKVEKDYYGWFKSRGLESSDADTVGSAVRSAWEACRGA